jgi:acyl carrier protein
MTKGEFLRQLDEIVEEEPGTLTGAELLDEVTGWDSLAVVSFIAMVDENLSIVVSPRAIAECKSVDDLVALAQGRLSD